MTDLNSYQTASNLLDEINYQSTNTNNNNNNNNNNKNSKQTTPLPKIVGLLANKRDLNHLREVSTKQGKALARKHGAGFWEMSAADDYYSTHGPLNSMVVESFLNTLSLKSISGGSSSKSSSLIVSSPTNLRSLAAVDESDENGILSNNVFESDEDALSLTPTTPHFRYKSNPFDFNSKNTNTSNDKRKSFKERKKDLKQNNNNGSINNNNANNNSSDPARKVSVGKLSLDNFLVDTNNNNNNNNSPDSLSLSTDNEDPVRSSSWSKKDKKRYSIRKSENKNKDKEKDKEPTYKDTSTPTKELTTSTSSSTTNSIDEKSADHTHAGVLKCHSCSDIKKWDKEGTPPKEDAVGIDNSKNGVVVSGDRPPNNGSLTPYPQRHPTNSFTRLSSYSSQERDGDQLGPLRSPRSRKERRKTTGLTLKTAIEADEMVLSAPLSPDITTNDLPSSRFKRSEKKSVRRKISSIFRGPKLTIETPSG